MNENIKKMLEKQLELLSEQSNRETPIQDLVALSNAMAVVVAVIQNATTINIKSEMCGEKFFKKFLEVSLDFDETKSSDHDKAFLAAAQDIHSKC